MQTPQNIFQSVGGGGQVDQSELSVGVGSTGCGGGGEGDQVYWSELRVGVGSTGSGGGDR